MLLLGIGKPPADVPLHVAVAVIRSAANHRPEVADFLDDYGPKGDAPLELMRPGVFLDNLKLGVYDEPPRT